MSEREQVETTADRLRDELLLTLRELERRRQQSLDVKLQLRRLLERHRGRLRQVGGAALVLLVLGAGYVRWRAGQRERRLWGKRRQALWRAWEHPDRVATRAEERPLPVELGRKLLLIFATSLASSLTKNLMADLVPRRGARGV
jgi:hypothetical protein